MEPLSKRKGSGHSSPSDAGDLERYKRRRRQNSHDVPVGSSELDTSSSSNSATLATLLDFSYLVQLSDIARRFDELASALLRDFSLVLQSGDVETEFSILELEFYLMKSQCHEDPFTHGSEEQKKSGCWYFHRAPRRSDTPSRAQTSPAGYRGGTRKGLDLTIAGPNRSPYFSSSSTIISGELLQGGILLRTLRRKVDSVIISGPSLLVDQILTLSGASSIAELVQCKWKGSTSAFPPACGKSTSSSLYLRPRTTPLLDTPLIYSSPRIGLDLSHPSITESSDHPRVIFIAKPYRYFTHPELLTANGRAQTFIGVLNALLGEGLKLDEVAFRNRLVSITGLKQQTVNKYLADYQEGLSKGILSSYIGSAGKGASASPSTYLKMMGALQGHGSPRL